MPPAGGESGSRNAEIVRQLGNWTMGNGTGVLFDSSSGFTLPNGALRSPDAAWVRRDRLAALSAAERERFLPLCPDFVVELMSPSDSLTETQAKMDEYLANGARLGWLIDRKNRRVLVYRPDQLFETLDDSAQISGDPVLPGFVLDLNPIFRPLF
jgi:Uma2 family endonuclease